MPPKKKRQKVDCPATMKQLCKDVNAWALEWEVWGLVVKQVVDDCCAAGDPEKLPAPPKPPFKP